LLRLLWLLVVGISRIFWLIAHDAHYNISRPDWTSVYKAAMMLNSVKCIEGI
jgi:hypothetical protein